MPQIHVITVLTLCVATFFPITGYSQVDFSREIQPLFAEHCTACHGPDKQKNGLTLATERGSLAKLKSGAHAVVPGRPNESEIIYRLTTEDNDEIMPPDDHGKPLNSSQIALIRQWISEGAKWSQHWAYRPLANTPLPKIKTNESVQNKIDHFVLAKLERETLRPSPQADRQTLIKRLNYDLIGLPPTLTEVKEFVNDNSPKAYTKLVNRLLASSHFGERWGRHWLDKARYADSDGYEKDRPRMNAWRYRDWVINSINSDLPFDQFTIQQLAGDLLPNATELQKLGTAFNRQTLTNTEGGTDQEQWRVAAVMDRVETLGSVWLGLTVGCARCHNHKYDQLTQKEYYQLFTYFNNGDESNTSVTRSSKAMVNFTEAKRAHETKVKELQAKITAYDSILQKNMPSFENNLRKKIASRKNEPVQFHQMELLSARADVSDKILFKKQKDGSLLISGENPAAAEYEINYKTGLTQITGIQIEVLPDESLPANGPGRTPHGNFVLNEVRIYASATPDFKHKDVMLLKLGQATADYSQKDWPAQNAIDGKAGKGKNGTGWAIANKYGKPHNLIITLAQSLKIKSGIYLHIVLDQQYGAQHTIGCFRITARTGQNPTDDIPDNVIQLLAKPNRTVKDNEVLLDFSRTQDKEGRSLKKELKTLADNTPKPPVMSVRVISQRTNNPRETHILNRGEFKQPREKVKANTFSSLPRANNRSQGDRLDLARWLVNGKNPIVPRVTINHIWANLFGQGLVRTMNDFGVRGDAPTHPALLDWLSSEFIRRKWSRKEMIRLIVHSATYQQSSIHRAEFAEIDPDNRLLHRQNRFRVEAEIVRDLALAASGQLSRKIGGSSVYPPLPPGVSELSYANNFKWKTSDGEDRYRRGMYTFFKRTSPHPNLTTFDCPDSNVTCVKRNISNTPIAALATLNNSVFTEAAKAMAKRLMKRHDNDSDRITFGFKLCTVREPTSKEIDAFSSLLRKARSFYAKNESEAKAFNGDAETSAWTNLARIFLNLDEFITRE